MFNIFYSHPSFHFLMFLPPRSSSLFPYTTLFRSTRSVFHTLPASKNTTPLMPTALTMGNSISVLLRNMMLPPMRMRLSGAPRSEEHTSELQSRRDLVCRLLLEKKKTADRQNKEIR